MVSDRLVFTETRGLEPCPNFLRTLSAAVGTAISVTSWDHLATSHHARLMENVSHYSQASNEYLATLQANGLSTEQAYGAVERAINAQSFMLATNDFFLYCAVAFFTLSGLVWLTKPKEMDALDMQNATGH